MKLTVGLLIFACITAITIHLAVMKKIDNKLTIILLSFAVLSGFVAANYDIIKYLKLGREGLEIETKMAIREIGDVKSSALAEIEMEVKSQKESTRLLISNANDISDKLKRQEDDLSNLIETAIALQNRIEQQKQDITKLNQESQATKQEIVKLNEASSQLALTVVRATYLSLETKNELGGSPRLDKAKEEILSDINRILPMVITNPEDRAKWIQQLQSTLPKKQ